MGNEFRHICPPETRRLLLLVALVFSMVMSVQYFELPYGNLLSSLFSAGKSQVISEGSVLTKEGPSRTKSLGNSTYTRSSNSTETNIIHKVSDAKQGQESENMSLMSNYTSENKSFDGSRSFVPESRENSEKIANLTIAQVDLSPSNIPSRFSSPLNVHANHSTGSSSSAPDASSSHKAAASILQNKGKPGIMLNGLSASVRNPSNTNPLAKKSGIEGPPDVVVPIASMNDMQLQGHASSNSMKPRWPSPADQELLHAKALIEDAQMIKKDYHLEAKLYRNLSAFIRSYELMEKTLKVYIYYEGQIPVFHQPVLRGIYASEGWFMKQLKENKQFVTRNSSEAHLFYLPFSSQMLEETLYVPGSHSRKNLVQHLSGYLQMITTKYRFWNRTDGSDHFLVACHDWAPDETSRVMHNCLRALCTADAQGRFQFGKDVSIPQANVRSVDNPLKELGGKPPSERPVLAFFAGKMHGYLRPILLNHWANKDPDIKVFGKIREVKGQKQYVEYMKSSKYCICAKGYEVNSPRVVEAILYECVPVIISDNFVPPFFDTLNWESFAVFILEKDIPNLKNILLSISEKRYLEMQQRVKQVQQHFLWHTKSVKYDMFHMILHSIWYNRVYQIRSSS